MKLKVLSSIELLSIIDSIKGKQSKSITNNQLRLCDNAHNELINRGVMSTTPLTGRSL